MNKNEVVWLKNIGVEGQCDKCPLRKSIEEMDFNKLPCNQYQCLVTLAKLDDSKLQTPKVTVTANDELVDYKGNVDIKKLTKELPGNQRSGHQLSLKKLEAMVGIEKGTFDVLEYVGVQKVDCKFHKSGYRLEYYYWVRCRRCGKEQLVSRNTIQNAINRTSGRCLFCRNLTDLDERLEHWDI